MAPRKNCWGSMIHGTLIADKNQRFGPIINLPPLRQDFVSLASCQERRARRPWR